MTLMPVFQRSSTWVVPAPHKLRATTVNRPFLLGFRAGISSTEFPSQIKDAPKRFQPWNLNRRAGINRRGFRA